MPVNTDFVEKVTVNNFDEGVILQLGGVRSKDTVDGRQRDMYRIKFEGLRQFAGVESKTEEPLVPCRFVMPEQSIAQYIVPMVVIRRGTPAFAARRWHPFAVAYRKASSGAVSKTINDVSGFDSYAERLAPYPFDIPYSIQLLARYETDALLMLLQCLRYVDPRGWVKVKLGEETRTYDAFLEGIDDISELSDVAGRIRGYAMSVRILAEIDTFNDFVSKSVLQVIHRIIRKDS